jgi:hypothetical protein
LLFLCLKNLKEKRARFIFGVKSGVMELLLIPLTAMGAIFILAPIAAVVPAVFFLWLFVQFKRKTALFASLLWLVYLPYEYCMKLRILCSGECNIRVDLLLIYPALITASLVATIAVIHYCRARRRPE